MFIARTRAGVALSGDHRCHSRVATPNRVETLPEPAFTELALPEPESLVTPSTVSIASIARRPASVQSTPSSRSPKFDSGARSESSCRRVMTSMSRGMVVDSSMWGAGERRRPRLAHSVVHPLPTCVAGVCHSSSATVSNGR